MAYNPQNPNGSATSANSAPVVIASNQSAVPVSGTVTANAGTGTQNVSVQNASLAVTGTFFQATQPVSATSKFLIGSNVAMTVTNLQSLASSATAGWQSDRVSNISTLARDYEINVRLNTTAVAPGSDKAMYVYICPWFIDGSSTWIPASQGTTTPPSGTQGTTTIASPNNLRLLGVLNYTATSAVVSDTFLLSNCFGDRMPDGFSIIIINFSAAALGTSCVVNYKSINDTLA